MELPDLWNTTSPEDWEAALKRYWEYVLPKNKELEVRLNSLDLQVLEAMKSEDWYEFLLGEYFRWKYTAPNRYATTTRALQKYIELQELDELDLIRKKLLCMNPANIRQGLLTADKIRGLGTAGASGLLSLMYPQYYGTVDQFVVKALRLIKDLPEAKMVAKMKAESLTITDGTNLIGIMTRKATELRDRLDLKGWTPRRIDMVLWTYGR